MQAEKENSEDTNTSEYFHNMFFFSVQIGAASTTVYHR